MPPARGPPTTSSRPAAGWAWSWTPILRDNACWTLEEINGRLREIIVGAAETVWGRAAADGLDPRLAANVIAVERVADATRLRGFYP